MIELEKSADAYSLLDADFELSFRHVGDRWQNCVSVRHHGEWHPLLTSEEGVASNDVPPSPPFQDLRCEQVAEDIFEFQLLGQSGKGVYSAAVRFNGGARTIDYDLCARGRSMETPLCTASRYILAGNDWLLQVRQEPGLLVLSARGGRSVEIAPVPIQGSPRSECRLTTVDNVRRIDAGCFETKNVPGKGLSVRWRYRMVLSGVAEPSQPRKGSPGTEEA